MKEDVYAAEHSPWIDIDLAVWSALVNGKKPRTFHKKSFLFYQNCVANYLYIIAAGRVCVTSFQENGSEKQLYIAEQGAICGENACLQQHVYASTAMAIVDTQAYPVSRNEMLEKLRGNWDLMQSFLHLCFRKNTILVSQVLELSFSQAEQRIARTLLNLAAQYGMEYPEGIRISIRFTHQDIASIVNTSRVTANNAINRMIAQTIIVKRDGHYILKDIPALNQIAEGTRKP